MIKIPEWIAKLKPYIPGKPIGELAREKSLKRIVKLASNENPLGPSPRAIKALIENLSNSHRYVERTAPELVAKIAEKFGKNPDQIICAHGVDALLGYIVCAFTSQDDEILTSEGTFIGIYVNSRKLGRDLSLVPLKNYALDLDSLLGAISPKTKIIYLANPNNPTGTIFTKRHFEAFMAEVPDDILVILDEAYTEFASKDPEFPNGLSYGYDNLLVTRTLSKSYGLAGLRVGFAVGHRDVISALYKVKLPFEPNFAAQVAALAALDDDDYVRNIVGINERSLKRMAGKLDEIGIKYVKSHANFLLMLMPSEEFAESFNEECLSCGLILRHVRPFGIPNGIRMNSADGDDTEFALAVIEKAYAKLLQVKPA